VSSATHPEVTTATLPEVTQTCRSGKFFPDGSLPRYECNVAEVSCGSAAEVTFRSHLEVTLQGLVEEIFAIGKS